MECKGDRQKKLHSLSTEIALLMPKIANNTRRNLGEMVFLPTVGLEVTPLANFK